MTPLLGRPAVVVHLRRRRRPGRGQGRRAAAAADRDHPAGRAGHRPRADPAARRPTAIAPDMVMGHSLGEYGALVAAGALTFEAALEAVSARGREMASLSMDDNGAMAAVFGPLAEIERIVAEADGYVVIANINSNSQAVIGGRHRRGRAGRRARSTPPASTRSGSRSATPSTPRSWRRPSVPLVDALRRLDVRAPQVPIVANVTGEFYPTGADAEHDARLPRPAGRLARAVRQGPAHPLRRRRPGLRRGRPEEGAARLRRGRPRREHDDVLALFTNHPKLGDDAAFNQALCGLYAAGLGLADRARRPRHRPAAAPRRPPAPATARRPAAPPARSASTAPSARARRCASTARLERAAAPSPSRAERGRRLPPRPAAGAGPPAAPRAGGHHRRRRSGCPASRRSSTTTTSPRSSTASSSSTASRSRVRDRMVDMRITRLVKSESGAPASRPSTTRPTSSSWPARTRRSTSWSSSASTRPATRRSTTPPGWPSAAASTPCATPGSRWSCATRPPPSAPSCPTAGACPRRCATTPASSSPPPSPGYESFVEAVEDYALDRGRREQILALEGLRARMAERRRRPRRGRPAARRAARDRSRREPYEFDRRFLFRVLSMGHSQFAELIGARGPNTQVNAACASTTQALSLAEDWIRSGRCRRVVVVSADDATGDAAAAAGSAPASSPPGRPPPTSGVEDAATPFDRAPARHDHRDGRGRLRRRVRRGGPRARHPAHLRGARRGHRQQRLPRHPARRRAHRRRHGGRRRRGRAPRRRPRDDRRRRRCSSPTRPTPRPAAAAPRRRSTRCAASSAPRPTRS